MKKQFEKVKKLALKFSRESAKLDRMISEKWGFHYSETDDDPIIDTLDYGTNFITYEEFVARMDQYKQDLDETGKMKAIP